MNKISKLALVCATVLSMGSLVACQSGSNLDKTAQDNKHPHGAKHEQHGKHRGQPMTEEQKAEFEKRRAEFEKQAKQACDGKVGQTVKFTLDDKTIEGTCEIGIKREKPQDAQGAMPPKADGSMPPPPKDGKFDGKKGDKESKSDREQRRAEMKAKEQQACAGKLGQKVSVSLDNDRTIEGTCEVMFKPNKPEKSK